MKIALFFTFDVSLQKWKNKGLLKREILFYEKLIEAYSIDIIFFTYGTISDLEINGIHPRIKIIPIYTKMTMSNNKLIRFLNSFLIPFYLRKSFRDVDIVKTNQMWGSWLVILSCLIYRKPLLLRTGYEFYKFSLELKKSFLYLKFAKIISYLAYNFATIINVSTNEDKKFVVNCFKINKAKIIVKPNWIDAELFKPTKVKKNKSILLVGRLERQKNYQLILKSIKNLDIDLVIIGEGIQKKELLDLSIKQNVNITFLRNISNDKMPYYYNKYLIYVICSRFEGNPKSLLEAMSCGSLVIGTNVTGINSIIKHKDNGLLTNENEVDLNNKIQLLLNDLPLRKRISTNARKYILNNNSLKFSVENEYKTYKLLIK